jgi:hypothetical protein
MGPFVYVDSIAHLLSDPFRPVGLFAPEDGSLWMRSLGNDGTYTFARWSSVEPQVVFSASEAVFIALDEIGRAWRFYQDSPEVEVWEDGGWKIYNPGQIWVQDEKPERTWWPSEAWQLYADSRGSDYLPVGWELWVFEAGHRTRYTLEDMGFPVPEWEDTGISHKLAMLAGGDQVWVGACYYSGPGPMGGPGVRYFDGSAWQGAGALIGPACVSAMEVDRAGDLWLGVENAVWRYQPGSGEWSTYPLPEALLFGQNFGQPSDILVDRSGDVYLIMQMCGGASCDGPANLYWLHAGKWTLLAQAGWWFEPMKRLVEGDEGNAWLFWEGAFYELEGASMIERALFEPRGVAADSMGRVWALVGHGEQAALWVLDGEQLK